MNGDRRGHGRSRERAREDPEAYYVFRVRFRLDAPAVETDPKTFETVVRYPAAELDRYNADSVREVRHNHLGSSVRVLG